MYVCFSARPGFPRSILASAGSTSNCIHRSFSAIFSILSDCGRRARWRALPRPGTENREEPHSIPPEGLVAVAPELQGRRDTPLPGVRAWRCPPRCGHVLPAEPADPPKESAYSRMCNALVSSASLTSASVPQADSSFCLSGAPPDRLAQFPPIFLFRPTRGTDLPAPQSENTFTHSVSGPPPAPRT
jgi:hypothetical protein